MNAILRNPDAVKEAELEAVVDRVEVLENPLSSPGEITRTAGVITQVTTGGRTLTITREAGRIATVTDGVKVWTYTRNEAGAIVGWDVEILPV